MLISYTELALSAKLRKGALWSTLPHSSARNRACLLQRPPADFIAQALTQACAAECLQQAFGQGLTASIHYGDLLVCSGLRCRWDCSPPAWDSDRLVPTIINKSGNVRRRGCAPARLLSGISLSVHPRMTTVVLRVLPCWCLNGMESAVRVSGRWLWGSRLVAACRWAAHMTINIYTLARNMRCVVAGGADLRLYDPACAADPRQRAQ